MNQWLIENRFSQNEKKNKSKQFTPRHYSGPKQLDHLKSCSKESEVVEELYNVFLHPLLEKLRKWTNQAFESKQVVTITPTGKKKKTRVLTITHIQQWLTVYLLQGLVRVPNKLLQWKGASDLHNSIYTNNYIDRVMNRSKWTQIDRTLSVKIEKVMKWFNTTCHTYWAPSEFLSIDDDLYLWLGKGGGKVRIARKADGTGVKAWLVTDQHRFTYLMFWDSEFNYSKKGEKGLDILKAVHKKIPTGPYTFCADAGCLSSYENALEMIKKHRNVLFSVASGRPGELFARYE